MRKTTPSLNGLRAFEAAARHQSFARAAEELCVTPGAVSQQIATLEARLNLPLFKRVKQRLEITDAGKYYLLPLKESLDRIESATIDLLYHGGNGGEVKVGVLPSLSIFWLMPRLKLFAKQHPGIRLNITTLSVNFSAAERSPDLEGGLIDVGLFYGNGHWDNLDAELFMSEQLIPVAAPVLIDRKNIDDRKRFLELPRLQHSTRPNSWTEWLQLNNFGRLQQHQGYTFEHFYMAIDAAKNGLGVAIVPQQFVQTELDSGVLIEINGKKITSTNAYYLVYDPSKLSDPKVQGFISWVKQIALNEKLI